MVQSMGGITKTTALWTAVHTIDGQLTQTSPPYDEYITEIRQRWIPTPFTEKATAFQHLQQDFQVTNAESSSYIYMFPTYH